jgi:hypothetical protein
MLSFVLISLSTVVFAQSDAQKSFDFMKSLAGDWTGPVTTDNPAWNTDKPLGITMRVGSRGNVLVHELKAPGIPTPEITVFYVDGEHLTLFHYCDYGNRSRMVARPSPDGKTVEFDLVEFSGKNEIGHVTHAVFTIVDVNHHIEDWTFLLPNDKPIHVHMDLKRVQ